MFFFGKKNKEYVSCDLIEHGMDFYLDSINFCCRIPPARRAYIELIPDYNGEKINWKAFFATKRKFRKRMQKGDIIPECKGCIYLKNRIWDDEDYISFINFNCWGVCNEHCVYCEINDKGSTIRTRYNVFPVIKDMADKGYLRKGGHITIAGGEPCCTPEFDDLLKLFLDKGLDCIRVLTNATVYSPIVEAGIKSGQVNLLVSIDAGTKEMFEKVKRRDFFDRVWENLRRYASVQTVPYCVKTKYLIIPGLNDVKEEADLWIQKNIENGIKYVSFDVEMNWYEKNQHNLPPELYDFVRYLVEKITEAGLKIEYLDRGCIMAKELKLI